MGLISRKMLRARPQELGKIKIGGLGDVRTAQSGRKYRLPVKFEHFVVTTRDRTASPADGVDGDFIRDEKIHDKIGNEPTELPGVLMFPTPEENLHAEMVQYKGQTKVVSCNGEERTNLQNGGCQACPRLEDPDANCGCKPYARFHIQLWDAPIGGYHVFRTTSWESTNNLQSALEDFYEMFGSLYHLPVKLILYPAEVKYEEGNKTKTSQAYMVGLVLAKSMEEAAREMVSAKRLAQATQREMRMLSGQVMEEQAERDAEESAAIASEFFPNHSVQASVKTQEKLDTLKAELTEENPDNAEEADYEIVEDDNEEAEAGSAEDMQIPADSNGAGAGHPPAEADSESEEPGIDELKKELADLMNENAPHLLNDQESRRTWTYRLIKKASPKNATEFELRQLIDAVKKGDTAAVPEQEQTEETVQATPFDDDDTDQGGMPV